MLISVSAVLAHLQAAKCSEAKAAGAKCTGIASYGGSNYDDKIIMTGSSYAATCCVSPNCKTAMYNKLGSCAANYVYDSTQDYHPIVSNYSSECCKVSCSNVRLQ